MPMLELQEAHAVPIFRASIGDLVLEDHPHRLLDLLKKLDAF